MSSRTAERTADELRRNCGKQDRFRSSAVPPLEEGNCGKELRENNGPAANCGRTAENGGRSDPTPTRAFPPPRPNGSLGGPSGSVGPRRPHGACGEQNANARLTWAVVRQIRADWAEGCKVQHIAWWRGVNPGTVCKIVNNQQWVEHGDRAAIPPKRPPGAEHGNAQHTWATVRAIRAAYAEGGETLAAIGRRFAVKPGTVHAIVHNKQWIEAGE